MAATKRLAATAIATAVILSGCTYSDQEPGFFPPPAPRRTTEEPAESPPPDSTNPALPIAGESVWTTGDGLALTVRFAVHAVRRISGATVLDWSVTPLSAPDLRRGDAVSTRVDLGLTPGSVGDLDISLLDPASQLNYQPLRHRSRRTFNHCLCTPAWLIQQRLRIGETILLQVGYPELPAETAFVDVALANIAPIAHVPVTPVGLVPVATKPVDLARPAKAAAPAAPARTVHFGHPRRALNIQIDRIAAGAGATSLEWTIQSRTDQIPTVQQAFGPPVGRQPPEGMQTINGSPTNGPQLRVDGRRLTTSWSLTEQYGSPAYDCRCSDLGIWARALNRAGGSLQVTSTYPALPPGTTAVDVVLPDHGLFRRVPVVMADDAARRLAPPVPRKTGTWHYSVNDPPVGWPTMDWPTDVPDSGQLVDYRGRADQVVTLPG